MYYPLRKAGRLSAVTFPLYIAIHGITMPNMENASENKPAPARVTLKEIASRCGVTAQTVSHILNVKRSKSYNSETVKRVTEMAHKLGYRPNSTAQAMRKGRHDSVLLLMSSQEGRSYLPSQLLDGIHDELQANNQRLLIARLDDDSLNSQDILPSVLSQWMADGMIVNYAHFIPDRLDKIIKEHRIPAVWVNLNKATDAVYPDDYNGIRDATQVLLEHGHHRIAFVNTMGEAHYSGIDRRRGYEAAMQEAGLKKQMQVLRKFLDKKPWPTAVVTAQPQDALTLRHLLLQKGSRVPEDLSLISVCEIVDDRSGPSLSSMLLPENELGVQAVRMLLQKINSPDIALPSVTVPLKLHIGDSVAKCMEKSQ